MVNKYYPWLTDKDFLLSVAMENVKKQKVRVELLDWNENALDYIESYIVSGNVSLQESNTRRTLDISIVIDETNNKYYDVDNMFSVNKKVFVEVGYINTFNKYIDYDTIWFPLGLFILTSCNIQHEINNLTCSLQGMDKMCLLDGSVSGSFPASTILDTINTPLSLEDKKIPIRDILYELVHHLGGESLGNILIADLDMRAELPLALTNGGEKNDWNVIIDVPLGSPQKAKVIDDNGNMICEYQTDSHYYNVLSRLPKNDEICEEWKNLLNYNALKTVEKAANHINWASCPNITLSNELQEFYPFSAGLLSVIRQFQLGDSNYGRTKIALSELRSVFSTYIDNSVILQRFLSMEYNIIYPILGQIEHNQRYGFQWDLGKTGYNGRLISEVLQETDSPLCQRLQSYKGAGVDSFIQKTIPSQPMLQDIKYIKLLYTMIFDCYTVLESILPQLNAIYNDNVFIDSYIVTLNNLFTNLHTIYKNVNIQKIPNTNFSYSFSTINDLIQKAIDSLHQYSQYGYFGQDLKSNQQEVLFQEMDMIMKYFKNILQQDIETPLNSIEDVLKYFSNIQSFFPERWEGKQTSVTGYMGLFCQFCWQLLLYTYITSQMLCYSLLFEICGAQFIADFILNTLQSDATNIELFCPTDNPSIYTFQNRHSEDVQLSILNKYNIFTLDKAKCTDTYHSYKDSRLRFWTLDSSNPDKTDSIYGNFSTEKSFSLDVGPLELPSGLLESMHNQIDSFNIRYKNMRIQNGIDKGIRSSLWMQDSLKQLLPFIEEMQQWLQTPWQISELLSKNGILKDFPLNKTIPLAKRIQNNFNITIDADLIQDNDYSAIITETIYNTDLIGYEDTELAYPEELKAAAGSAITEQINNIIKKLNDSYEYYYDVYGRFIFKSKKTFRDISIASKMSESFMLQTDLSNYIADNGSINTYDYDFGADNILLAAASNSLQYSLIKNDYIVWGKTNSNSKSSDPTICYHLSIANNVPTATIPAEGYNICSLLSSEYDNDNKKYVLGNDLDYFIFTESENAILPTKQYVEFGKVYHVKVSEIQYQPDYTKTEMKERDGVSADCFVMWDATLDSYILLHICFNIPKANYEAEAEKASMPVEPVINTIPNTTIVNELTTVGIAITDKDGSEYKTAIKYYDNNSGYLRTITIEDKTYTYFPLTFNSGWTTGLGLIPRFCSTYIPTDWRTMTLLQDLADNTNVSVPSHYYPELKSFWLHNYNIFPDKNNQEGFIMHGDHLDEDSTRYYLDLLVTDNKQIRQYSVDNIGYRTTVVNADESGCNCIYVPETPEYQIIQISPTDWDKTTSQLIPSKQQEINNAKDLNRKFIVLDKKSENIKLSVQQRIACFDKVRQLLDDDLSYYSEITLDTLVMYNLDIGTIINVTDEAAGINGRYIITGTSLPLDTTGTMSITCKKIVDRI